VKGQIASDDIEAMATNPPSTPTVTSAIWTPLPRQPKQMRCRQFLAHGEERRTYYWIMESTGPICQQCVNTRNTKVALAEQEAGKSGNPKGIGKSGKPRRSIKAPAFVGTVLAKRAMGQNYSQIARDTGSSRNTVKAIVAECEFDQQIAEGRRSCVALIPKAVAAVDTQLSKGDGTLGRQLLNDTGVIGEHFFKAKDQDVNALQGVFNSVQVLINAGKAPEPAPAQVIDIVPADINQR